MTDIEDQLQKAAQISGMEADPLAEYSEDFKGSDVDFFNLFINQSLENRGLKDKTIKRYRQTFQEWTNYMEEEKRHPAFPTDDHVKGFIQYERDERGNSPITIKGKLRQLQAAYDYWVEESHLPHPTDYQPIRLAKKKVDLKNKQKKEVRILPVEEMGEVIQSIPGIRERTIVALQLKLGLRATEVSNIKIGEISIQNSELQSHFPQTGTHRRIDGYVNVVFIPSKHGREGNKSYRPRLLPLDEEMRHLLLQYLLVRPSVDEPWLFLSKRSYQQLYRRDINRAWSEFHERYGETEDYRKITSHYGRHRFVTYWKVEQDLQRDLIEYMRGDEPGGNNSEMRNGAAINQYIHTNFEDIEDIYRRNIYKFDL